MAAWTFFYYSSWATTFYACVQSIANPDRRHHRHHHLPIVLQNPPNLLLLLLPRLFRPLGFPVLVHEEMVVVVVAVALLVPVGEGRVYHLLINA